MAAHAILGASSSKRWMHCPGSVKQSSAVPSGPSSKYAEEGTAAHTLGEWCLEKMVDPREFKGEVITTDEGSSFVVNDDMIDAVRVYFELIRDESLKNQVPPCDIRLEERFNLSWLHDGMFGTNDASFSIPFGDLYIYDYKHGAGVAVDAIDNTQLVYYAIGASYDLERQEWHDYEKIHMTIVQPRAWHEDGEVRRWTITMEELKEWAKKLKVAAIATEAIDAPLNPSEDACRWCNASSFCPAIKAKAIEVAKTEFGAVVPTDHNEVVVDRMTLEECVNVVNHKGMLTSFIKACEWRLEHSILNEHKKVEGMKVIRGRGSRDWIDKTEAQRTLSQTFAMGDIMKMELKSPAQLEKIVGKKLVSGMVVKKEGMLKVAPLSHKSKAVDMDPSKDFQ